MGARQGRAGSLAARVTYLLEPKNWLIVTVVAVGAHADGLAGAGWGLLAAFFAAVLPTAFISRGIRRGRWEDRNVGARGPRLVVLAFITASVAAGLILLAVLGAPALLTGYLGFMLASVAALAAITVVWKISIPRLNYTERSPRLATMAALMAEGADRPLRADAARNREKVLRAAREAFAESGYGVPLDEIAARAGVGPGTVYRHFPAKEALFEAVVAARLTDLVRDARDRAGAADPGEAFFGFLGRLAEEAAAKRDLPDAISVAGSLREEMVAALDDLLDRAQRAGAVRAGVRAPDLVALLKGMFASLADGGGQVRRDLVFAVLADGLRPPR